MATSIFSLFHNVCHTMKQMLSIRWRLKFCSLLTFSQRANFRIFQTEGLCRQQFKFDENGEKFFKQVENTVGIGEIARFEQFLLFPQCFHKT